MRPLKDLLGEGGAGALADRKVLVRSDLNVPLDGDRITDDGRIRASAPTISELTGARARVVVTSHLGRPNGGPSPEFSLAPVAARLGELLGVPVRLATLAEVPAAVVELAAGEVRGASGRPPVVAEPGGDAAPGLQTSLLRMRRTWLSAVRGETTDWAAISRSMPLLFAPAEDRLGAGGRDGCRWLLAQGAVQPVPALAEPPAARAEVLTARRRAGRLAVRGRARCGDPSRGDRAAVSLGGEDPRGRRPA